MLSSVRRARRRILHNELLAQGANASSAAVLALILLLLLGTEILDWRWILLVTLVAAAAGLYRARRRVPSHYGAAQVVDRRLSLADTLSTAVYFSGERPGQTSPEFCQLQFERAGKISETVDVSRAVPYAMPRTAYLLAVLLVVAGSLFALRYGFSRSLDLKPPLASMLPFHFGSRDRAEVAQNNRRQPPKPGDPPDDGAALSDPGQSPAGDPDASDNGDNPGSDPQTDQSSAAKGQPKAGKKDGQAADGNQDAQAEQNADSQNADNAGQQGNNKQDSKQASAGSQQEQASNGENSSLMNKMKDMFQNLLSSVKPPQSNPSSQQQQNSDNGKQQGKSQQNGGKQQQGKNGEQQNNGNQGDAQEGQPGDQAQSPQDPQGKGDGKSDSQQASKQPGSGIGSQNGDKSIKQAEDLAAMGKLTEILGKRSANISGEATVEVQSTSQQLHTPYAQRAAQHAQNGAQINRDEIPISIEAYVQQYFEEVRKQAVKK